MRHNDNDDSAALEPMMITVRALTGVTAFIDEAGDFVCFELPAKPRSVMVAATEAATEGLLALLNGKLRDIDLAPSHDNWVRLSLRNATATTTALSEAPADELLLLVSDGLDSVPVHELEALVKRYEDEPRQLADAIAAARADAEGYRDDATAVVLTPVRSIPA